MGRYHTSLFGCGTILTAIIDAFLWPYTLNTWLILAGKDPSVVWWQGMLLGLVPGIGQFGIIAATLTWIVMLFISCTK
jgi:hypothetical protein